MTFLGQRFNKSYNAGDGMTVFNDIQDIVNLLELDNTTAEFVDCIRKKVHYILQIGADDKILKLKKDIQNLTIKGNKITSNYSALLKLTEILEVNPAPYLKGLLTSIDEILSQFIDEYGSDKEFAEYKTKNTKGKSLEELYLDLPHTDFIYHLHEKIKEGSELESVIQFSQNQCSKLDNNTIKYWDYNDIIVCSQAKKQLLLGEKSNTHNRAFSLSGGMSNGISQLGYIREHIKNGGTISAISGSSIGGIMGALVAFAGNDLERIDLLIESLSQGLRDKDFTADGNLKDDSDRQKILDTLTDTAKLVGIDENTRFSESSIPVVVNASKVSGSSGEKEVYLGGERSVIESLMAGANMLNPIPDIRGEYGSLLGETTIDGVMINDYAANEKGNPIKALDILGIPRKFMTVIDVGYSSETYNTPASLFSRAFFQNATMRDLVGKMGVSLSGGNVINIDARLSENKSGQLLNREVFDKLIEIGIGEKREIVERQEAPVTRLRI